MRARALFLVGLGIVGACTTASAPGGNSAGMRDEIVIAGRRFSTGTRVVLFSDPGGFDAYREHCFLHPEVAGPRDHPERLRRYGSRRDVPADVAERVGRAGWTAADLATVVHQVVLHYDAAGTSRRCFEILQDLRGLSCHFLLDEDGTVYQTLDVKERAWHASIANDHSVGIEIANPGACPDPTDAGRPPLLSGKIRGVTLWQRPFTDAQYVALGKLVGTLCRVLRIPRVVPRDPDGKVRTTTLPPNEAVAFEGIVGHLHVSGSKVDPGPAFDWERLLGELREDEARGAR